LRGELEEKEYSPVEIELVITEERAKRYMEIDVRLDKDLKVEKEKEMERVTDAFGISRDYKEGDAFKFPIKRMAQEEDEKVERIEQ
jgi:hypothetical protein